MSNKKTDNKNVKKGYGMFSRFMINEYIFVLIFVLMISAVLAVQALNVEIVQFDYKSILPSDSRTMTQLNFAEDNFMNTDMVNILIYKDSRSSHIDFREDKYIKFIDELESMVLSIPSVSNVQSINTLIKLKNNGSIDISRSEFRDLMSKDNEFKMPINPLDYMSSYVDNFDKLSDGLDQQYIAISELSSISTKIRESIETLQDVISILEDETSSVIDEDVVTGPNQISDGISSVSTNLKAISTALGVSPFASLILQNAQGLDLINENFDLIKSGLVDSKDDIVELNDALSQTLVSLESLDSGLIEYEKNMLLLKDKTFEIKNNTNYFNSELKSNYEMLEEHLHFDFSKKQFAFNNKEEFSRFISNDNSATRVQITLKKKSDFEYVGQLLSDMLDTVDAPENVNIILTGMPPQATKLQQLVPKSMSKSSSFAGIFIVVILLLLLHRVVLSGFTLSTIMFGTLWTFGFLGVIGMDLNAASSAALSMILGIGIDFGIQIVSEFIEQYYNKKNKLEDALAWTVQLTLSPILITTASALIGFIAMSLADVKIMQDMSYILIIGVLFCILAAFVVLPCLIIMYVKVNDKLIARKRNAFVVESVQENDGE